MTDKEIEAYKAGFINALDLKEKFKCQIFGYDIDEILNVMAEHRKKQTLEINIIEDKPVIIKRNGKIVYKDDWS